MASALASTFAFKVRIPLLGFGWALALGGDMALGLVILLAVAAAVFFFSGFCCACGFYFEFCCGLGCGSSDKIIRV